MSELRHINLKVKLRHERILETVPGRSMSERVRRVIEAYETQAILSEQVAALKARLDRLEQSEQEARTRYLDASKELARIVRGWLKSEGRG